MNWEEIIVVIAYCTLKIHVAAPITSERIYSDPLASVSADWLPVVYFFFRGKSGRKTSEGLANKSSAEYVPCFFGASAAYSNGLAARFFTRVFNPRNCTLDPLPCFQVGERERQRKKESMHCDAPLLMAVIISTEHHRQHSKHCPKAIVSSENNIVHLSFRKKTKRA